MLRDDFRQVDRIDALVAGGDLFVAMTVVVELEWVLRGVYKLARQDVAGLLMRLTEIDGIVVEDKPGVRWAIERHAAGADFADMIHLLADGPRGFVTFDKRLARDAGETSPVPIETLG